MYQKEENNEQFSGSTPVAPKESPKKCIFVRLWEWIKGLFK